METTGLKDKNGTEHLDYGEKDFRSCIIFTNM